VDKGNGKRGRKRKASVQEVEGDMDGDTDAQEGVLVGAYLRGREDKEEQFAEAGSMEGTSRPDVLMGNVIPSKWLQHAA
jgi:hypothetical protein